MLFIENIVHKHKDMAKLHKIIDQFNLRMDSIQKLLENRNVDMSKLDAVVGRGGPIRSLESGTYLIDKKLLNELKFKPKVQHASLLGGILAEAIARKLKIQSFIVDPVSVDEMIDIARISGLPELPRLSLSHALSLKASARKAAEKIGKPYEKLNLIVVHMGSGISVTAHSNGKMIDVNNPNESGPFSPERCGGLPIGDLAKLCYSGKYTLRNIKTMLVKKGGLFSYLGTNDVVEIEKRIKKGDKYAKLIHEAMVYQISKEIGAMATTLKGDVDGIVLTGALAHSKMIIKLIKKYVGFIAKTYIFPGTMEEEALAFGVLRILSGKDKAKKI